MLRGDHTNLFRDQEVRRVKKADENSGADSKSIGACRYPNIGLDNSTNLMGQGRHSTGLSGPGLRVKGGTNPQPGQFPFFATVIPSSQWLCGASLVAPDIVITAGHCAEAFTAGAVIGARQLETNTFGSLEVQVTQQILHPHLKNFLENDVLILKTSLQLLLFPSTQTVLTVIRH